MPELREYQKYVFNKFKYEHDKLFLVWFRQSGKSFLMVKIVEDFILNNKGKKILFFVDKKQYITHFKDMVIRNIPSNYCISKHRSDDCLYFINDNFLQFCSFKQGMSPLFTPAPDLVILDTIFLTPTETQRTQLKLLKIFMDAIVCKWIVVPALTELPDIYLDILDNDDTFYVNVLSYHMLNNGIETPKGEDSWVNHYTFKEDKCLEWFHNKRPEMVEYMSKNYMRRLKLKKLKKIQDGNY